MGFLGRVGKESGDQPGTTVVAGATKVVGDLQLEDNFHLDGSMSGKIHSSLNISIGVHGEFDGEIQAKKVMISGRFDGTIDAERLEIVGTGRVSGEINVAELVIEPGGQFSGVSQIRKPEESEPRRISYQANGGSDNQAENSDDPETESPGETSRA